MTVSLLWWLYSGNRVRRTKASLPLPVHFKEWKPNAKQSKQQICKEGYIMSILKYTWWFKWTAMQTLCQKCSVHAVQSYRGSCVFDGYSYLGLFRTHLNAFVKMPLTLKSLLQRTWFLPGFGCCAGSFCLTDLWTRDFKAAFLTTKIFQIRGTEEIQMQLKIILYSKFKKKIQHQNCDFCICVIYIFLNLCFIFFIYLVLSFFFIFLLKP